MLGNGLIPSWYFLSLRNLLSLWSVSIFWDLLLLYRFHQRSLLFFRSFFGLVSLRLRLMKVMRLGLNMGFI